MACSKGPPAIEGAVHDLAGYAVRGHTFGGRVGLVGLFNLRLAAPPGAAAGPG